MENTPFAVPTIMHIQIPNSSSDCLQWPCLQMQTTLSGKAESSIRMLPSMVDVLPTG